MKPVMILVSAISPFPTTSGGATRMYHTLRCLSGKYELHFLTFGEAITDSSQKEFLDRHCASWAVFPLRSRTLLSPLPYYFSCWKNEALEQRLGELIDTTGARVVRIEFTQLAYLVKYLPRELKKIFIAHDISTISFARRHESPRGRRFDLVAWLKNGFTHASVIEIKTFERTWLPFYDEVVAMSDTDREQLKKMFHLHRVRVEPNGITACQFLPKPKIEQLRFGYFGSPQHPPNATAIKYTVEAILPSLRARGVDFTYVLAGSDHEAYAHTDIQVLGPVVTPRDFYEHVDMLVAPLFAGSGTRVKILESLSYGIPVITTPIGAEGLELTSDLLQVVTGRDDQELLENLVKTIIFVRDHYSQLRRDHNWRQLKKQLQAHLWEASFAHS